MNDIFHLENVYVDVDKANCILQQTVNKYKDTPLKSVQLTLYGILSKGSYRDKNDFHLCINRHASSEEYVSSGKNLQKVYQTDNEHFHRLVSDVLTSIRVLNLPKWNRVIQTSRL